MNKNKINQGKKCIGQSPGYFQNMELPVVLSQRVLVLLSQICFVIVCMVYYKPEKLTCCLMIRIFIEA